MRSRLASGSSSRRFSLRMARLMTCQVMASGRAFSTSKIQRDVSQVHGHTGSNQKSTGTRVRESFMVSIQTMSRGSLARAGDGSVFGARVGEGRRVGPSGDVVVAPLLLPLFHQAQGVGVQHALVGSRRPG